MEKKYGRLLVDIDGRGYVNVKKNGFFRTVKKAQVLRVPPGLYNIYAKDFEQDGITYQPKNRRFRRLVRNGSYRTVQVKYRAIIPESPLPDNPDIREMHALVNQIRTSGFGNYPPVKPVKYSAELSGAAQAHADDMATNGYFSHVSKDGRTFEDRVAVTKFLGDPASENIASGFPAIESTVNGWLNSPEHCENLMYPELDYVGYGLAIQSTPGYSNTISYWVQDFGYKPSYH